MVNDTEVLRRYRLRGGELVCLRDPQHPAPEVLDGAVLLCVRCGHYRTAGPGTIARARRHLGASLTDAAVAAAGAAADGDWKRWALRAVLEVCRERGTFTTDEAAERLGVLASVATREPRAWGAVMRSAASQGWCEATGEMRLTVNPSAHRRPKRVWRSLLSPGA